MRQTDNQVIVHGDVDLRVRVVLAVVSIGVRQEIFREASASVGISCEACGIAFRVGESEDFRLGDVVEVGVEDPAHGDVLLARATLCRDPGPVSAPACPASRAPRKPATAPVAAIRATKTTMVCVKRLGSFAGR